VNDVNSRRKEVHVVNQQILSRVQGCLMGIQIGDAMGMPWEIMTPEEILAATDGKGVQGFSNAVQRRIKGTASLKAGDTTDDWQLTAANVRSLIQCGGYDQYDAAREQVYEFERCAFGWGSTTKNGLTGVKDFFESNGKRGRDPHLPVSPDVSGAECGNGVAMKIAPLALFHGIQHGIEDLESLRKNVMKHGLMTHPDSRASISAYAIVLLIIQFLTRQSDLGWLKILEEIREAERVYDPDCLAENRLSTRLTHMLKFLTSTDRLRDEIGTGCFALESVPFAIAVFFRHPNDFRQGILEAVNAGGDTDTIASMVGALIGANAGLEAIPEEWKNFRPEYNDALELGSQLYEAALENKNV